jgi:flagellar assembly protein FliH
MRSLPDVRASIRHDGDNVSSETSFALTGRRDGVAEAKLEGYRDGREEGFRVGREEGRATAQAAVAGAIDALGVAVSDFQRRDSFARAEIERIAVDLALELAEVLLGRQLTAMEPGSDVIARALELRRGTEPVWVRMHPVDAAALSPEPHPDVRIIADPALGRGCAAAEIGEGLADLSIAAAVERVRAVLG